MGLSDFLGGLWMMVFSLLVFIRPKFFVNEQGQYIRFGRAFHAVTRIHLYAGKIFY